MPRRRSLTSGCFSDKQATLDVTETTTHVKQPFVNQGTIMDGFDRLRDAGLRVSIPESFTISSLQTPGIRSVVPRSGMRVRVGAVVTLEPWGGPLGSLLMVCKPMPTWTVEELRGLSLAEAIRRVPRCFFWEAPNLPPLHASDATRLLDAYRVVSQQPAPGTELQPGILGKGYLPTPVIFRAELTNDPASS